MVAYDESPAFKAINRAIIYSSIYSTAIRRNIIFAKRMSEGKRPINEDFLGLQLLSTEEKWRWAPWS